MAIHHRRRLLFLAAVLALPPSAPAIITTGQYTVTILGRVQHNYLESTFRAAGINDNGIVAGSAPVRVPDNPSLALRGVLWQSSTPHYTILGTISELNGYDSLATCINNSGIAAGRSSENTSHGFVYVPVMFTPNGIVDLGVKNATSGIATGINNNGQVVGNLYFDIPETAYQAFLYQNGVMTPLGYPVPNDAGQIVAGDYIYQNGVWKDLNDLDLGDGWTFSVAFGINNEGAIIGDVFRIVNRNILSRSALLTPVKSSQQPATRTP